ncbi:MAG: NAD-dependent epimerase/dehydratase family protein, partial [Myxococcota bacterium]
YGPWGRPDMALFLFTKAILEDRPIQIFNQGEMLRDFTYVDDIVEGMVRLLGHPAQSHPKASIEHPHPAESRVAPHRLFNIGNHQPTRLMDMIQALEQALGKEAKKELLPMQPGDVQATYADVQRLSEVTGFTPGTSIQEGVTKFVQWYRDYYPAH